MSTQPNNPDDRLERMLRQWGSQQAVEDASAPHAPKPRRRSVVATIGRWVPLAAAAALVIIAGGLYEASTRQQPAVEPVAVGMDDGREGEAKLGELEDGFAAVDADLTPGRRAAERGSGYVDIAGDAPTDRDMLALREERNKLAKERDELAGEVDALRGELAHATSQMHQLLSEYDRTLTPAAEPDVPIAGAAAKEDEKAKRLVTGGIDAADTVALYLSMAAPGESGVSAVQIAAVNRKLIRRCDVLKERVAGDDQAALFQRLEAVLTQLAMLNADDTESTAAFAAATRAGDLRQQLTESLRRDGSQGDTRMFLLEMQLILQGVDRAK
ncbi:MAG: hypothetical protein ACYS8X_00890 [Planctomycetota bacterium]|jgi:hypothetical protein